jgi:pimeloyl-ACP methyl ester carboxylesterase
MRTLKIAAGLLLYFNIAAPPSLAQSTSPIVFIPGFAGSYLCEKGKTTPVWPGKMDHRKIRLPMDVNLDTKHLEHEACGVVREPIRLGSLRVSDVYGDFLGYLKTQMGDNLKILEFSYDWRLTVEHNAHKLQERIDQEFGGETVDIIAHSFGGLVARYYIQNLGGENRVRQLITMGTPHRGSTDTFQTLYDGWGGGVGVQDKAINWWMGGTAELRKSLLSFPGFYDMLPNFDNCCWFSPDTPFDSFDVKAWSRFSFYTDVFRGPQEQTFLDRQLQRALDLHRGTLSVDLPGRHREGQRFIVTGLIDTVTRVYLDARTGERLRYERNEGDGTVPLASASEDRKEDDRALTFSPAEHMRIFNEQSAKETVVRTIRGRKALTGEEPPKTFGIETRDNQRLGLRGLGYEVTPGVVGPGETVRLTVWLKGNAALSTADISNLSARTATAAGETELTLKSEQNAQVEGATRTLIADFAAPNAAGAYIVRIHIPGLVPGLAEEHKDVFMVVEN